MRGCAGTQRTGDIHYQGNRTPVRGLIPLPSTSVCKTSIRTVTVPFKYGIIIIFTGVRI